VAPEVECSAPRRTTPIRSTVGHASPAT